MKINEMSVGATSSGSIASAPTKLGKVQRRTEEAANPAQQAAIAVSMKKAGKKPKNLKEGAVKQLIMDLRELKDKEFMKKYGKSKEEMKQGLKSQVDENMFDKITSFIGRPFDQGEISKDLEKRNTQVSQNMQTPNATRYSNQKITREGIDQEFDMRLAEILKQRGYKGPVKLEQLGKRWINALDSVVDLDDYIMVQGNDPKYDAWVSYVYMIQKYAYGAESGYTTGNAKRVEVDTRIDEQGVNESAILQGMIEARVTEDELLLMPGQGVRFKPDLIPKKTDHEVEMARQQLIEIAQNAEVIYELIQNVSEMQGLDAWIQKKIVIANDYMESVSSYLRGRMEVDEQVIQPKTTSANIPTIPQPNVPATRPAPLAGGTTTQAGTSPQQVNTANLTGTGYQQGNSIVKANPNQIQQDVGTSQAIGGTLKNIDTLRQAGPNTFAQVDPAVHNTVGGMKTAQQDVNKRLAVAGVGQTQPIQPQQPAQPENFSQYADDELEEDSVKEKLHRRQQELRKKSGLPDPNYYKELKGTYDMPDDERWARTAELKKKYKVKEQETTQQDQQPQQEPKQGMDVKKGLGLLSTIGRALNTVTSPTFGDDVKADIRTMIHNKVTGTPNK